jgi:hypothetical protein
MTKTTLFNSLFQKIQSGNRISTNLLKELGYSSTQIEQIINEAKKGTSRSYLTQVAHCPYCNTPAVEHYSTTFGLTNSYICNKKGCTYVFKVKESKNAYFVIGFYR